MSGLKLIGAAIVLAFTLAPVSNAQIGLTDDQRREALLLGVTVEDDGDLRSDRIACDRGEMLAKKYRLEADGTPFPAPHTYCRAVLREEALRGRLPSYRHKIDYQNIQKAVLAGESIYLDYKRLERDLICEAAYDAGYQAGTMSKNRDFQPQLVADAETNAKACFFETSFNLALGFIAGVHHGQLDQQEIDYPS